MTEAANKAAALDLSKMTPEQIVKAYDAGDLAAQLGLSPEDVAVLDKARTTDKPLTRSDLDVLYRLEEYQLIMQAVEAGRIAEAPTAGSSNAPASTAPAAGQED